MNKFENIQQIKDHEWFGNAYCDMPAFQAIDEFVHDTKNSIADRAESLRIMTDAGMGCGRDDDTSDEELLQQYFAAM